MKGKTKKKPGISAFRGIKATEELKTKSDNEVKEVLYKEKW